MKTIVFVILTILAGQLCQAAVPEFDFIFAAVGNAIRVANASNTMTMDLFRRVADQGNVFFAPLSISTVLAMTYQGSAGKTAEEIATTMGYAHTKDLRQFMLDGFKSAQALIKQDTATNELIDVNMMHIDVRIKLLEEMKTKLENYFGATVEAIDFQRADTLKLLDSLVAVKTKNNIKKAFGNREIPPNTVMVLANIIYFKGIWEKQFDPKMTEKGLFLNNGQSAYAKEVDFMKMQDHLAYTYYSKLRLQALDLGYSGYQLRMTILLPDDPSRMGNIIDNLSAEDLTDIVLELEPMLVEVKLPRFKIASQLNLKDYLRKMGMRTAFDPSQAELPYFTGDDSLHINEFVHQAVINVNEQGTQASAASTASQSTRARVVKFHATEPFLFFIRDSRTNLVLFAGKVTTL